VKADYPWETCVCPCPGCCLDVCVDGSWECAADGQCSGDTCPAGPDTATDFIVDGETGDDSYSGHNTSHAFKTIQQCVNSLQSFGDSCNIRAGRYHEEVTITGLRGPHIIRGYGEERPIWDGTVPIQPEQWNLDSSTGICSAAIEEDIFALLLDDELLTAARWPNALWSDKTAFNHSFWGKCDNMSEYGYIIDDGSLGLSSSGINATGAMAILNIGSHDTFVRPVLHHEPGTADFTYNHDFGEVHWNEIYNQYYLEASLELLDNPGEWFYDVKTKILHLIPPSGECPDSATTSLRGRTIDYSLTITNTTKLSLANMTFFASTIHAYSVKNKDDYIDDIRLDSLELRFQSSSRRMLGSSEEPLWTRLYAYARKKFGKLHVVNCTFEGGEGFALEWAGENSVIENNLFMYNDWAGHDRGNGGTAFSQQNGLRDNFTHNTLMYNGRSVGVRLGEKANIEYNEIIGQCFGEIQHDGAAVQVQTAPQDGVMIHHNWIHDSPKGAIRFDGGGNKFGYRGYQGFNVIWNTGSLMIKGDEHTILNNLGLSRYKKDDGKCNICVIYRKWFDPVIQNSNTVVLNNAASQADGGRNVECKDCRWPLTGKVIENNYSDMDLEDHLEGASILDFRPIEGGALTDGTVIKGPYLPGTSSSTYWIPGRRLYKASKPIPSSGSTVPISRNALIFQGGFRADQHHVYLGLTAESMDLQQSLQGEENIMVLAGLGEDTQYFWRVDSQRGGDVYTGDIWNFYTE